MILSKNKKNFLVQNNYYKGLNNVKKKLRKEFEFSNEQKLIFVPFINERNGIGKILPLKKKNKKRKKFFKTFIYDKKKINKKFSCFKKLTLNERFENKKKINFDFDFHPKKKSVSNIHNVPKYRFSIKMKKKFKLEFKKRKKHFSQKTKSKNNSLNLQNFNSYKLNKISKEKKGNFFLIKTKKRNKISNHTEIINLDALKLIKIFNEKCFLKSY